MLTRKSQRRQDAQYVGRRTSGEAMLLEDELLTDFLLWDVEHDTNHESASAQLRDMRLTLLQLHELLHEVLAYLMCIVHKMLVFEHVEHSQSSST